MDLAGFLDFVTGGGGGSSLVVGDVAAGGGSRSTREVFVPETTNASEYPALLNSTMKCPPDADA